MKYLLLSIPLLLVLLTAYQKENIPGPLAYTLNRSVSLSPAGLRLDTTYTSSQLRLQATLRQWSPQEQDLFLHFRGETTKDEVTLAFNQRGTLLRNIPATCAAHNLI
jgi:hypothetical protein